MTPGQGATYAASFSSGNFHDTAMVVLAGLQAELARYHREQEARCAKGGRPLRGNKAESLEGIVRGILKKEMMQRTKIE